MNLKKAVKEIKLKNLVLLTMAGFINAFGITIFLAPVHLYDSGISGTSMLLSQITPEFFSLSLFLLILNFPLFVFGYKKQGLTFTIYSLYAVCMYSLGSYLITDVLPIDVSFASPLAGNDLLLCALFGGLISGVGSGLTKIPAKGGYSNGDMTVLYFILDRFQISKMTDIVHDIDKNAFITISEVADVFKSNINLQEEK